MKLFRKPEPMPVPLGPTTGLESVSVEAGDNMGYVITVLREDQIDLIANRVIELMMERDWR
jgi:hypothetical protein